MYTSSLPHITTPQDHNTHSQGAEHHAYAKIYLYLLWSPQLLTLALLAPGGQGKVLQPFDYLRTVADEPKRFQMLVLSLTDEPVHPIYQVQNTSFFDKLHFFKRKSTRILNLRIHFLAVVYLLLW